MALAVVAVVLPAVATAVSVPHSFQSGDTILASEMNENFDAISDAVTNLETIAADQAGRLDQAERALVPVGAVIDWWRPNVQPPLPVPEGFALCDGAVIDDVESPYFGENTPNLADRFVRGIVDANDMGVGDAGGSDAHLHQWSLFSANENWWSWDAVGDQVMMINWADGIDGAGTDIYPVAVENQQPADRNYYTEMTPHIPSYVGLLKIMRIR